LLKSSLPLCGLAEGGLQRVLHGFAGRVHLLLAHALGADHELVFGCDIGERLHADLAADLLGERRPDLVLGRRAVPLDGHLRAFFEVDAVAQAAVEMMLPIPPRKAPARRR
jgi:hypothetical protein